MKANSRRKYFSLQSFHHQVYIAQKDTKTLHIFGISLTPRVIGTLLNVWRVKSLTSVNSLDLDWLLHCLLQYIHYSMFDLKLEVLHPSALGWLPHSLLGFWIWVRGQRSYLFLFPHLLADSLTPGNSLPVLLGVFGVVFGDAGTGWLEVKLKAWKVILCMTWDDFKTNRIVGLKWNKKSY